MSDLWGYANIETNKLVGKLNKYIVKIINDEDIKRPYRPMWHNKQPKNKKQMVAKTYSKLAGLGNFGLNSMIITK